LGAWLDEGVRFPGFLVGDVAGNRECVAIVLERHAGGNARAGVFGGYDHRHTDRRGAKNAVADGEVLGAAKVPSENSEIRAPPRNLFRETRVFFAIDYVNPGAKHRDRLAFGSDCAAMARAVDAAAMPLMMTNHCAARSVAWRSAMPEP